MKLPGYINHQTIYSSANSIITRARREKDDRPVILKRLNNRYPSAKAQAAMLASYDIMTRLHHPNIVQPLEMINHDHQQILVMEDIGGQDLNDCFKEPVSIDMFLTIAQQAVAALGEVHHHRVIHKDINPANIVLNPNTGQVQLIDFGMSSQLSREHPIAQPPSQLEGTLQYISPEQTGRMNRALDYRSDFYSLGVTFYQLLTGALPFEEYDEAGESVDAMALVHAHLAKTPQPAHERREGIPLPLSHIIDKLMAKSAEDRYQSAQGLANDLATCQQAWQQQQHIPPFTIAKQDVSDHFQVSQILYGREEELNTLRACFDKVAGGITTLVTVSGYSGVGKSVLVQELQRRIVGKQGLFIRGKFNQLQRAQPYSALKQAMKGLCKHILTENEKKLAHWQQQLLQALGNNAALLIEFVPEMAPILGPQPAVATLSPKEAQHRFTLMFMKLINVIASKEQPLVIFLDDLQWADSATLHLLKELLTDTGSHHLMCIGAYRDNEVNSSHPTMRMVEAIRDAGIEVPAITVKPLKPEDVNALVAHSLHHPKEKTRDLAALVMTKTAGNPFFINRFLEMLYQEALIDFDAPAAQWTWSLEKIKAKNITDNVVELMLSRLRQLPPQTQELLSLAACIGNRFYPEVLTVISRLSIHEVMTALKPAIQSGVIVTENALIPKDDPIHFLHDRVQQAAYALIPQDKQQATHLTLGRLLWSNSGGKSNNRQLSTDQLFAVVNQLQPGADLIESPEERLQTSQLFLQAGIQAKAAQAYDASIQYLHTGIRLLPNNAWQQQHDLTFQLHKEQAESYFLTGQFEQAAPLFETALSEAKSLKESLGIYLIQIEQQHMLGNYAASQATARTALSQLGINLPEVPDTLAAAAEEAFQQAEKALSHTQLDDLVQTREMTDTASKMKMEVLAMVIPNAYLTGEINAAVFAASAMIDLTITHGSHPQSPFAYANYSVIVGYRQQFNRAMTIADLSLKMMDQYNLPGITSKTLLLYQSVASWKLPLRQFTHNWELGWQSGIEGGDILHAGYHCINVVRHKLAAGYPLATISQDLESVTLSLSRCRNHALLDGMMTVQQALIRSLNGLSLNIESMDDQSVNLASTAAAFADTQQAFQENAFLSRYESIPIFKSWFYFFKLQHACYFGHWHLAPKLLAEQPGIMQSFTGQPPYAESCFLVMVLLTQEYPSASIDAQQRYESILAEYQSQMKIWANHCPANFQHKYLLVEAERARLRGDPLQVIMDSYEQAIASAEKHAFIQFEALACELYAHFLLGIGKEKFALVYLRDARFAYEQWGALAKVKQLDAQYPGLMVASQARDPISTAHTTGGSTHPISHTSANTTRLSTAALDLTTVMKATRSLTSELAMDSLTARLMTLMIENAGATKGALMLEYDQQWVIQEMQVLSAAEQMNKSSDKPSLQDSAHIVPIKLIQYVLNSGDKVLINHPGDTANLPDDPYLTTTKPQSILCIPIHYRETLLGALYLEHAMPNVFTERRFNVLQMILAQAAISLENTRYYGEVRTLNTELTQLNASLEARVEARTAELQQANADLDTYNHSVSHDLQAPLRRIRNFCQLLMDEHGKQLDDEARLYLAKVQKSSEKMDELIRGLLHMSRMGRQVLTYTQVDLSAIAQSIVKELQEQNPHHKCEFVCETGLITQGDERLLFSVLQNLLGNAWKYSSKKPVIQITFEAQTQKGRTIYCVRDKGAGFNMKHADKLFSSFSRLHSDKEFEGSGIGLATVKRIIQRHRGDIWAESVVGEGSKFYFTLGERP